MLSTYLQQLEQPVSNPNEKYFGYYLPQTDTRYLRRHLNKNGGAHNGFIGCFKELRSYNAMIVLVKVSIQNPTAEPLNNDEFHRMFTASYITNHESKYKCSSDEMKKYKFEYFMIEYPNVDHEEQIIAMQNLFNSNTLPITHELIVKLLLHTVGNYFHYVDMLDITTASSYRCSILTDIEFIENPDSVAPNNTFMITGGVIVGLFNYFKDNIGSHYTALSQKYLFDKILCPDNKHQTNCKFSYAHHFDANICTDSSKIFISYEMSSAYGNSSHFESITWKDVIGSKLACYMCPSYVKKSLSYKLLWFNDSERLTFLERIVNLFEMLNHSDMFKLCVHVTCTNNTSFKYSFYISDVLKQACFTPDKQNRIYFKNNIDNILKIISDTDDKKLSKPHLLEMDGKVNTKIIFNSNPYGIYNPNINGVDDTIDSGSTGVNGVDDTISRFSTRLFSVSGTVPPVSSQLIDSRLNMVFPTMASTMQPQIIPFSYQKRNIIWMNDVERKVIAGEHKMKIKSLKLTNYINHTNIYDDISLYKMFDDDYYYIGSNYNKCDDSFTYYLYSNKDNCLDMEINLSGGFICDDVGLGKTYSTISHIMCQRTNDMTRESTWDLNNCIIIPSRLLQQWKYEIEKYTQSKTISVVTLGSITDIKKLYKKSADGMLYMPVKYDVYIISVNLLNNKNYMSYIAEKYETHKSDPVYNPNKYFDIFRIKWNRIIVDEVHERIMSTYNWTITSSGRDNTTMAKADRILTNNIVYNMTSNFRWGLSATPFEHTSNNIIGYICWQAKELKTNLSNSTVLAEKYNSSDGELQLFDENSNHVYNQGFRTMPMFINSTNIKQFQQNCFTKTTKRYVSGELNIPIFTEEIKEIELGQIERNVYNNARADNSNVRHTAHIDRLKRLFQLCTNICISDVDIENLGLNNTDSHMTLEQLNKAMIKNFEKLLKAVQNELERERADGPSFEQKKLLSKRLKDYIETCVDPGIANEMNSYAGQRIKYFIEACGTGNGSSNGTKVTDIDMIVMKNLRRDLYGRLLECSDNLDNLFVLVSEIMCTHPSGVKPDWNDNKVLMVSYYLICSFYSKANQNSKETQENITKLEREVIRLQNQIKLFESNDFIKEKTTEPCIICWAEYADESSIAVTDCRHIFCGDCFHAMGTNKSSFPCPECRADVHCKKIKITTMKELNGANKKEEPTDMVEKTPVIDWKTECISKYGTKMSVLIEYLNGIISEEGKNNRAIIFSQYDNMLKLIGKTLTEYKISNVYCKGNVHVINKNIDKFKRDPSIRVIMLSSEHSNSGSNLTEASHIILVDVLNMDKEQTKEVECQAIGRAVRLGQQKPVTVVRLITKNTVESEYYGKNKYDIATIQ